MKKLLFLCMLLLSTSPLAYGQKTVNKFIDRIKKHDSAVAMTLPGWVIKTGINISTKGIDESDENEIVNLGKKIKKLRFAVVNGPHHITPDESVSFLQKVKDKEGFEEYAMARNGDTRIYVMVKEEKEKIKYLMIYALGDDNVALINLKTDMSLSDLKQSNFSWNNKVNETENIN